MPHAMRDRWSLELERGGAVPPNEDAPQTAHPQRSPAHAPRLNRGPAKRRLEGEHKRGSGGEGNRQRDRSGHVVRDQDRDDANHGEPPVFDLGQALPLELLRVHFRGEADGIPEGLEALEVAGLAARRHVVRLDLPLGLVLDDADGEEDLRLAERGHGAPLLHGRELADVLEGDALGEGAEAREVNARDRDEPAGEGGHRHAAVLQLGVAEEGERCGRAEVGEAKRVPRGEARLVRGALHAVGSAHRQGARLGHRPHRRQRGSEADRGRRQQAERHLLLQLW
mmetsp:Transcript_50426/g.159626  ORF Transcript_50426/g.159626 Transcript_50426/m.159626 type:complete len:282 (+) Transcript_50426:150-995(+)